MIVEEKEITPEEMEELTQLETTKGNLKFCLLKVAEECNELAQLLIKKTVKRFQPEKIDEEIIEEIGDLELRLKFLKRKMNIESAVVKRIASKGVFLLDFMRSHTGTQINTTHEDVSNR